MLTDFSFILICILQGAPGSNITIDTLCAIMNDEDVGDPLKRYAKVNSLVLGIYGQKCLDSSYANSVAMLSNISWTASAAEGGRNVIRH